MLEVDRGAGAGAVEVDHVQRLGALPDPAPRGVARVGVERGLALVVALDQAHRAPAADVDRRVEDQAGAEAESGRRAAAEQIAAKLPSRRSPAALDFSGWNWTP